MTAVEGGKGIRFFQAKNAFLKQMQTDAEEIGQLRAHIVPTRKNLCVSVEQACQNSGSSKSGALCHQLSISSRMHHLNLVAQP